MPEIKCVVVDFDGTLTEQATEGPTFESRYRATLAAATTPKVLDGWSAVAKTVDADPEKYGLVIGERVVAAGDADPYLRCFTITYLLDRELSLAPSQDQLGRLGLQCYGKVYAEMTESGWSAAQFRSGAEPFLRTFRDAGVPVWIVTNADATNVKKRLAHLPGVDLDSLEYVGNALKQLVCPAAGPDRRFDDLPPEQTVTGLGRPIQLKRGRYFEALKQVWQAASCQPSESLVVGDIYDMDLALPAALGAEVHLIEKATTRTPYLRAIAALEGRGSSGGLGDAFRGRVLAKRPRPAI